MIRIGIIGCGKIAQVRHLPEYATNPDCKLVAYYDKNLARAHEVAAQYGGTGVDHHVVSDVRMALDALHQTAVVRDFKALRP